MEAELVVTSNVSPRAVALKLVAIAPQLKLGSNTSAGTSILPYHPPTWAVWSETDPTPTAPKVSPAVPEPELGVQESDVLPHSGMCNQATTHGYIRAQKSAGSLLAPLPLSHPPMKGSDPPAGVVIAGAATEYDVADQDRSIINSALLGASDDTNSEVSLSFDIGLAPQEVVVTPAPAPTASSPDNTEGRSLMQAQPDLRNDTKRESASSQCKAPCQPDTFSAPFLARVTTPAAVAGPGTRKSETSAARDNDDDVSHGTLTRDQQPKVTYSAMVPCWYTSQVPPIGSTLSKTRYVTGGNAPDPSQRSISGKRTIDTERGHTDADSALTGIGLDTAAIVAAGIAHAQCVRLGSTLASLGTDSYFGPTDGRRRQGSSLSLGSVIAA